MRLEACGRIPGRPHSSRRAHGSDSEALLDILAEYADVPRDDSRFDDLVKTSAIILQATPSNVPFAQITQLYSKVFFRIG
jgi:hypothetical protein